VINQGRTRLLVTAVAAVGPLLGCSEARFPMAGAQPTLVPTSTTVTRPPLASTTPPLSVGADTVAAAEVINAGPKGLAVGSRGAPVTALEARLAALRFNPGKADGAFDAQLAMAVMAFQKQQDMPRTGRADPATLTRLAAAGLGIPMVATAEGTRVEIDLRRQMAQFWKDGRLLRVLAVSTGSGAHYCIPKDKGGGCDTAITPGGSYRADRKIPDVRVSPLGTLYNPVYFYGGIAIHGSPSIPATPASHGCVRVAMWESGWVYNNVSVGDPVYVVGGKVAPLPLGAAAPVESPEQVTAPPAPAEDVPVPATVSAA